MGQVVKATLRPLYPQERQTQYSWFQTFALIWILHIFFWVFPRRQIVVGRRFGTMYQFHLQRLGVHCTPSLWRWNWYRVPKRRPTTIWRRGNTQKKIYNIYNIYYIIYKIYNLIFKGWVYSVHPAFEDGTDTGFRNVGQLQFYAWEIPRRKYTNTVLIVHEAQWAPEPVWTGAENLSPTRIRSPDRPPRSK